MSLRRSWCPPCFKWSWVQGAALRVSKFRQNRAIAEQVVRVRVATNRVLYVYSITSHTICVCHFVEAPGFVIDSLDDHRAHSVWWNVGRSEGSEGSHVLAMLMTQCPGRQRSFPVKSEMSESHQRFVKRATLRPSGESNSICHLYLCVSLSLSKSGHVYDIVWLYLYLAFIVLQGISVFYVADLLPPKMGESVRKHQYDESLAPPSCMLPSRATNFPGDFMICVIFFAHK